MSRYIDADKIISHLKDEMDYGMGDVDIHPVQYGTYLGFLYAKSLVETAETADVQEVRHAKRIRKNGYICCSDCGSRLSAIKARYCHHCGAKMDEEEQK